MKRKIFVAILIIVILVASTLIVFYLTSSPKLNLTLSYDFESTMQYNYTTNQWYDGSLLGWNASGGATANAQTDAVVIYPFSSISRQFQALDSAVAVSFNWTGASGSTETMTMVVHRQLNGVFRDVTYESNAAGTPLNAYPELIFANYKTTFSVDNGTLFTVKLWMNNNETGFLEQAQLWNSAQVA